MAEHQQIPPALSADGITLGRDNQQF